MDEISMMIRNHFELMKEEISKQLLPIKQTLLLQQAKNKNYEEIQANLQIQIQRINQLQLQSNHANQQQLNHIKAQIARKNQANAQQIKLMSYKLENAQQSMINISIQHEKNSLQFKQFKIRAAEVTRIYADLPKIPELAPCQQKTKDKRCQHPQNPHNNRFIIKKQQNKITATLKGQDSEYYIFVKNDQLQIFKTTTIDVKQVKTKKSFIMSGIGTKDVFGMKHAYNSEETLLYDSAFGKIAQGGVWKKGSKPVQDGDIIRITVDTEGWWIAWAVGTVQLARVRIPVQMRSKALYIVVMMYNKNDSIEIDCF